MINKNMNNEKEFKEFLKLFQYPEGKEKEIIDHIVETMNKAEKENKVLKFDLLDSDDYLPNPCMDRDGNNYFDTRRMHDMFVDYLKDVKYVKTEIALHVREKYLNYKDIAVSSLK